MAFIKKYRILLLIIVVGLALRLYHLTAISLWHDEAFSVLLVRYPWGEMFHRIGLDVHPPLYYIILRLWHYAFGDSLWSLRGFSVLFGVGLIPLSYVLVKAAFKSQRAALITATLVAVNAFQIYYVYEARMYTMGAFFAVLAAWGLVKAMELQRQYYGGQQANMPNLPQDRILKRKFLLYYLVFTLGTIAIIYIHYYLLFTATAIGFFGLLYHWHAYKDKFQRYGWLMLSFAVIALSFLPWLKIFLSQVRRVGGDYWIPPINRWSIPDTLWRMFIGLYTNAIPTHLLLVLVVLVVLVIFYFIIRRTGGFAKWLVLLNIVAPFAGSILFALLARWRGENSSVYLLRYFVYGSTFFLVAISLWLEEFRPRKLANVLLALLVIVNVWAFAHDWYSLDISHHRGMAGAADYLAKNVEPGQKLYIGNSGEFFNFKYYNRTPARPLLYHNGAAHISQMPHYAGTALLNDSDLVPDFKAATQNGDTVWLLWTTGFNGVKPPIPANWTQIDEQGFADVRPYVGTWIIVDEYKVN